MYDAREVEEPFAYGGGAVRVATEEEQEAARRIQRKFHFAKGRQHLLAAVERATKGSRVVQRAKQFEMQQGRLTQIALNRGKSRRTIAPEPPGRPAARVLSAPASRRAGRGTSAPFRCRRRRPFSH